MKYTPQTQGWGGIGGYSTNAQALPPQAQGMPQGGPPQGMPPQAQGTPQGGSPYQAQPQEAMLANAIREQAPRTAPQSEAAQQQSGYHDQLKSWLQSGMFMDDARITPSKININPLNAHNTVSETTYEPGSIQEQRLNEARLEKLRSGGGRYG
jgi:hypothetical protein